MSSSIKMSKFVAQNGSKFRMKKTNNSVVEIERVIKVLAIAPST